MRMVKPEDLEFDIFVDEENMIIQATANVYDAVPVVRCKDCKWWKNVADVVGMKLCTYVIGAEFVRNVDDFCSRGERNDDNET